ncbi:MAG: DUF1971 domain-containing protein [Pseudomonadota bacterium]
MSEFPPTVNADNRTPVFTEQTVPTGLLRHHKTKPGVWAVITIMSGTLEFIDEQKGETRRLEAGDRHVIAPQALHCVKPCGSAAFFVEFYR